MASDDWDLWAPFLAVRPSDRQAERLRAHAREDAKRGQRHAPRRADALSREEIVRAAIAIADTEGAEAVSMRRIARELNAGTMSLYWHVGSKEELLDLMIDSVQGDLLASEPSGNWRKDLRLMACSSRAGLHRHRWMMDFMGGRPPVGPKSIRNVERALGFFDGLGLDMATALNVVMTVMTYVMGACMREVQEMNGEAFQRERMFPGLSEEEKQAVLGQFMDGLRSSGRYPRLAALVEQGVDPDSPHTRDERFEFGLDRLLDGIAACLEPG
jgi:AcrR family transcriptional regulator